MSPATPRALLSASAKCCELRFVSGSPFNPHVAHRHVWTQAFSPRFATPFSSTDVGKGLQMHLKSGSGRELGGAVHVGVPHLRLFSEFREGTQEHLHLLTDGRCFLVA